MSDARERFQEAIAKAKGLMPKGGSTKMWRRTYRERGKIKNKAGSGARKQHNRLTRLGEYTASRVPGALLRIDFGNKGSDYIRRTGVYKAAEDLIAKARGLMPKGGSSQMKRVARRAAREHGATARSWSRAIQRTSFTSDKARERHWDMMNHAEGKKTRAAGLANYLGQRKAGKYFRSGQNRSKSWKTLFDGKRHNVYKVAETLIAKAGVITGAKKLVRGALDGHANRLSAKAKKFYDRAAANEVGAGRYGDMAGTHPSRVMRGLARVRQVALEAHTARFDRKADKLYNRATSTRRTARIFKSAEALIEKAGMIAGGSSKLGRRVAFGAGTSSRLNRIGTYLASRRKGGPLKGTRHLSNLATDATNRSRQEPRRGVYKNMIPGGSRAASTRMRAAYERLDRAYKNTTGKRKEQHLKTFGRAARAWAFLNRRHEGGTTGNSLHFQRRKGVYKSAADELVAKADFLGARGKKIVGTIARDVGAHMNPGRRRGVRRALARGLTNISRNMMDGPVRFKRVKPAAPKAAKVEKSAPKTLYVMRPVVNAHEIINWAQGQGFKSTIKPEDLHVTIALSRAPINWQRVGEDWRCDDVTDADVKSRINGEGLMCATAAWDVQPGRKRTISGGSRAVAPLGDKGAVVLKFDSPALTDRWLEFRRRGASWDHPGFQPHLTLTYDGKGVDLSKVEPYAGDIVLGEEDWSEVDEAWADKIDETKVGKSASPAARITARADALKARLAA